jgi:CheY-like chemotaxis protein
VPIIVKCLADENRGRPTGDCSDSSFQPRRAHSDEHVPVTLRSENYRPHWSAEKIRVLICDDESRLVNLTAGLLREFGYEVLTVKSGEEAIACVAEQAVDVVILDVNLPGEDTLAVARKLTEQHPVAIVLSSGFAEEDVEAELTSLPGVRAFLPKPYGIEVLSSTIRRVIEESR